MIVRDYKSEYEELIASKSFNAGSVCFFRCYDDTIKSAAGAIVAFLVTDSVGADYEYEFVDTAFNSFMDAKAIMILCAKNTKEKASNTLQNATLNPHNKVFFLLL